MRELHSAASLTPSRAPPPHTQYFYYPWQWENETREEAISKIKSALTKRGAQLESESPDYLYFVLPTEKETIDVEFLLAENDTTVAVRAAGRRAGDAGARDRIQALLTSIKRELRWTDVPILRNRKRALFFLESPWDEFGPEGPLTVDDYLREGPVRLPDRPGPKEECFDKSLALKSCVD